MGYKKGLILVLCLITFILTHWVVRNTRNQCDQWSIETSDLKSVHNDFQQRLPSAIIIGAQKAGTRALITFLAHHPSIVTAVDEIDYFSENYPNAPPFDLEYEMYRQQMPFSLTNQVTIEKSPNYFHNKDAPARMFKYQNYLGVKLKLILIVTHPVKRSVSHFFHQLRKDRNDQMMSTRNLTEALLQPLKHNHYLRTSLFGQHLKNWLKYFAKEQFLIINGTTFAQENPSRVLQKCEEFLGIPIFFTENKFRYQPHKGFYCYGEVPEGCLGEGKGHQSYPQRLPDDVFQKLESFFHPDQLLFSNLTT